MQDAFYVVQNKQNATIHFAESMGMPPFGRTGARDGKGKRYNEGGGGIKQMRPFKMMWNYTCYVFWSHVVLVCKKVMARLEKSRSK